MIHVAFRCGAAVDADAVSEILLGLGAYSVEVTDRNAGSSSEQFLFHEPDPEAPNFVEPRARDRRIWNDAIVSACLPDDTNVEELTMALLSDFDLPQTPDFSLVGSGTVAKEWLAKDWVSHVQSQFKEIRVGNILIRAPWHEKDPDAEERDDSCVELILDHGISFGTGEHPTTQLVLEWLQDISARLPAGGSRSWSMLDYGCGTGVLAIAGVRMGASEAVGCDIDQRAVQTAANNAEINSCGDRIVLCNNEEERKHFAERRSGYEVVVANILSGPLKSLAPCLSERLAPNGVIALSGILADQAQEVSDIYSSVGIKMQNSAVRRGWALLVGSKCH